MAKYEPKALDGNGNPLYCMTLYNYDKNKNVIEEIKSCKYVELDGRPIDQVLDNEQIVAFYIYNADGTIKNLSYGNGVQTHYEYDGNKNIAKLTTRFSSGNVLTDNAYFYDNNGNQVQKMENGVATTYQYDPINQIQKVVYNRDTERQKVEEFVYDAAGNRVERTIDNAKEAYYYDKKNRLTKLQSQLQGTTSFEYDNQGNTLREISKAGTREYGYDIYNRTTDVKTADGYSIRNIYDPIGLRAKVERDDEQSKFVFSGWSIVAELDSEFNVRAREVRGYGLLEKDTDGQKYYYHHNEHGDVTALTDVAEEIKNSYSYDVFGNVVSEIEGVWNAFKYAGEQYDQETSQYYLRARFYNPTVGQFTQEDVYRDDGLNLYVYVQNNPNKWIDPSGYSAVSCNKNTDSSADEDTTLFHYTNEDGLAGILESNQLNPSLRANNPKDARYGDGQYLSDISPESKTPAQLASTFIRVPNKYKYTDYVEVDVSGLDVVKGREGVYVVPNGSPLDLTNRIVSNGKVGDK